MFRDKKGQFRIHSKKILEQSWHSNIDAKAMSSLSWGFKYTKKYLLKAIDFEGASSKTLKTFALCWLFRKRAFSVSGLFRKILSDMICTMHNSNNRLFQMTLLGIKIEEEGYFVIGFVPASVIRLKDEVWFAELDADQIDLADRYLSSSSS